MNHEEEADPGRAALGDGDRVGDGPELLAFGDEGRVVEAVMEPVDTAEEVVDKCALLRLAREAGKEALYVDPGRQTATMRRSDEVSRKREEKARTLSA